MSDGIVFCLCFWSLLGVFSCVSVTEGDSVTLHINLTEQQMKEGISWKFGAQESVIAEINRGTFTLYDDKPDRRFKNRLKLNRHTGDLSITNTSITHNGTYQVTSIKTNQKIITFNLTVHARLPVPVITNPPSSSSNCSVLCSVLNVSHVSLSWYKGSSLLSSISVSDHHDIINIPLILECVDDSYSCVLNNSITNQTQHLTTDLCHKCSDLFIYKIVISCVVVGCVMSVAAVLIVYRKHKERHQEHAAEPSEITYAETTFCKTQPAKPRCAVEDNVVYSGVMS